LGRPLRPAAVSGQIRPAWRLSFLDYEAMSEMRIKEKLTMSTGRVQPSQELIALAQAQVNEHPNLSANDLYSQLLARYVNEPSLLRAVAGASIAADPGLVYGVLVSALLWPIIILRDAIAARRRERMRAEVEAAVRIVAPDRCVDWSPQK